MARKPVQDFFLFLIGGSLFVAGIFLFTNQVIVGSGFGFGFGLHSRRAYGRGFGSVFHGIFSFGRGQGFGLLMIPFGAGVALLLADTYRKLGWFLVWACSAAIGAAILQSLFFSFRPVSLWSLISMVSMIGGGAGLMLKSLRDYQGEERDRVQKDLDSSRQEYSELKQEIERLKKKLDKDTAPDPD